MQFFFDSVLNNEFQRWQSVGTQLREIAIFQRAEAVAQWCSAKKLFLKVCKVSVKKPG